MIEYDAQAWFGVPVMLQMSGSVIPQSFIPACISMVVCALVLIEVNVHRSTQADPTSFVDHVSTGLKEDLNTTASGERTQIFLQYLTHPYPHQISALMIGFMMIFRVQLSYQRYWEGIGVLTDMHTKWYDAATQVCAFDELAADEAERIGVEFRRHAVHLFSLMSGCSLLELKHEDL